MERNLKFLKTMSVAEFKAQHNVEKIEVKRNEHTGKCFFVYGFETGACSRKVETGELKNIDEIGEKIAQSIITYFSNPVNRELVERLKSNGLQLHRTEEDLSGYTDKLAGQSIVISGVFTHHSRDEYKEMIEKNGGKNVGSISSKTSFILAGENMGPAKLEKAQKLGVKIMSEDEFLALLS